MLSWIQIATLPEETKKPPNKQGSEGSLSNLFGITQKLIATSSILEYHYLCYMCLRHLKGHDAEEWITAAFMVACQLFFFPSAHNKIELILEYWWGGGLWSLTRKRETEAFLWVGTTQTLWVIFPFWSGQKLFFLFSSPPTLGKFKFAFTLHGLTYFLLFAKTWNFSF